LGSGLKILKEGKMPIEMFLLVAVAGGAIYLIAIYTKQPPSSRGWVGITL